VIDLAVVTFVCGKLRFRWTILVVVAHLVVDYVISISYHTIYLQTKLSKPT
jgi:hypothetical protein